MKCITTRMKKLSPAQKQEIKSYCKNSNALYNCALYLVKNYYESTGKYMGYAEVYHHMKTNIHYNNMPSKAAQQTLRILDRDYRSFFSLLKMKNQGLYDMPVNPPHFKKKQGEFIVVLPNDQVKLSDNKLKLTKTIRLSFTYEIGTVKQAVIKPMGKDDYELYITYEEIPVEKVKLDDKKALSIDFGINNLMSCFTTENYCFIINGKPLKSYNQKYNKKIAKIKSELEVCNKKKYSNKLKQISYNRKNYIDNYLNQSVNVIKQNCIDNQIGNVVIGYNEGWKQNCNLGYKTNQKFQSIPFHKLKSKLTNKLEEIGVKVHLTEESYTSKCSFLDDEAMKHQTNYMGKRIKRGLFKSKDGIKINADINGAANILRKTNVVPKVEITKGILDSVVSPKVLNIFNLERKNIEENTFQ